ncbi:transcriptional regulator [Labrys sp. LIt4]|uniref:helix-turn-helix domain-containing protein n=1 Tax=Labrys sp. LIt4 TaxID=2821355 RepID=UPI001ADF5E48|nr:helix-turn-helix domain-containing protein [Labrys sp. LIt4]MBP0583494.1 transcriptional regulator [Labrys sp. LIt4]
MLFRGMRYATILQPGQVWISPNDRTLRRVIIDVFKSRVLYRMGSEPADAPPNAQSRSEFRRWIAENQAELADQDVEAGQKVSPSAELGKRIRALRQAAGLTQQQLADAVEVSRAAVAFWETGREGSINKHLTALCEALGVGEDTLLNGLAEERIETTLSPDEADLIALYRMLSPSRKLSAQKWLERQTNQHEAGEG